MRVDCLITPMILDHLRAHTATAHQALENEVKIADRVQNLENYRHLLERFYGFHLPFEGKIGKVKGWEATGYNPRLRLKSPWLRKDLEALGLEEEAIQQLPVCPLLPEMRTLAQGFGCAYVIEGSTLGGRHIAKLLDSGSGEGLPRRFFQSYGEEVGPRWKEFCARLEQFAAGNPQSEPEILWAAQQTFTCFHQWLR